MIVTEFQAKNQIPAIKIQNCPYIDIFKSFDCGQCFRFDPVSVFDHKYEFGGVAFGRYVIFAQDSFDQLYIYNCTAKDFDLIWCKFLSLEENYEEIDKSILSTEKDIYLKNAVNYGKGIRILKQDMWEALCSFIISQNNNIPRIKKIISAMCEKYGEKIEFLGSFHYSFPSANVLLDAGVDEILALKTGFRAKYIIDACSKIVNNEVSLANIYDNESFDFCLSELYKIKGVGLKVASCALLFGFNKTEAFPVDVWMKRVLLNLPSTFDYNRLGKNAGIAQQYLFYYERYKTT